MFYALFVAVVSALFAVHVVNDHRRRPRPYKAYWATALAMSAAGSLCYAIAAAWTAAWAFRLYYLFGALLVAPYMALGSLFLAFDARKVRPVAMGVHLLGLIGAVLLFIVPLDMPALEALAGASGSGVLEPGAWLPVMIVLNLFGVAGVVGVALYSLLRPRGGVRKPRIALGNGLIALGFLTLAMAGSVARFLPHWDGAFWVAMAAGWGIAYAGYRTLSHGSGAAARS